MSYNLIADYSQVTGGRLLPFLIELDIPNCILEPEAGHNQTFSYVITGQGGGNAEHLASFVLGISETVGAEQIKNISVTINGDAQTVRFDTANPNVYLTHANPDCAGLQFDFWLNRNNGVMTISFELTTPYEVGSVSTCLIGADGAEKYGLTIGGPFSLPDPPDPEDKKCFEEQACEKNTHKDFDVSVPVSIKPFAKPHRPHVHCLGDVKITPGIEPCPNPHNRFDFTITQKVSVKIPVEFGVKTCFDKTCVEERAHEHEGENEE